jgi:hypothetical protein
MTVRASSASATHSGDVDFMIDPPTSNIFKRNFRPRAIVNTCSMLHITENVGQGISLSKNLGSLLGPVYRLWFCPAHPKYRTTCQRGAVAVRHAFVALSHSHRRMAIPDRYPTLPAALLALLCAGCASVPPEPTSQSVPTELEAVTAQEEMRDLTAVEKSILADGFTAGLGDPGSAKFRWTKVPKHSSGNAFEYCGLINLKSGKAGYTGMKPFLATVRTENGNIIGGAIAALNNDNLEENRDVIPKLCRLKGLNPFEAQ